MRPNGFLIVIDLALQKIDSPLLNKYRKALILGTFRENVYYIPGIQTVSLNPSISHFYHPHVPGGIIPFLWPGPLRMGDYHFKRAVREFRANRPAAAFVQLGRVSHLLTDMACPVHAQSVFHSTDPFEWAVEAMRNEFRNCKLPATGSAEKPSQLIEQMAQFTQAYPAEKVNNPWGSVLRRMGVRKTLQTHLVRKQVAALIPVAASHTVELFKLFLEQVDPVVDDQNALPEILRSLQMSPSGLRKWFAQMRRFCAKHGGKKYYSEILELLDECENGL